MPINQQQHGVGRRLGSQTMVEEPPSAPIPAEPAEGTVVQDVVHSAGRQATDGGGQGRPNTGIAIICALQLEYDALREVLDGRPTPIRSKDGYYYYVGRLAGQEVAIALMSDYGSRNAVIALKILEEHCRHLKVVILLGICAGIPERQDSTPIYLGDVIFATAVLAHAKGARQEPGTLALRDNYPRTASGGLQQLITMIGTVTESEDLASDSLDKVKHVELKRSMYKHPGEDLLFSDTYHHFHRLDCPDNQCSSDGRKICEEARKTRCKDIGCDAKQAVRKRENWRPSFSLHTGVYASADLLVRDPVERNRQAQRHGVLAFETEAAGIWDLNPYTMVIKAVSDYGDTHKSRIWQRRAALHAACTAKSIVEIYFLEDSDSDQRTVTSAKSGESMPIVLEAPPPPQVVRTRTGLWSMLELSGTEDYQHVTVPEEISASLEDWLYASSGNNFLLWGWDESQWVETAMKQMAQFFAASTDQTVLLLDCDSGGHESSFMAKLLDAISHCLAPKTPDSYVAELKAPSIDALRDLDGRLDSTIIIFIYGRDQLRNIRSEDHALQCIRLLLQSVHFKVLLTSDNEVDLGNCLPNITENYITGYLATFEMFLVAHEV